MRDWECAAVRADVVHVRHQRHPPSQPAKIRPIGLIGEIPDVRDVEAPANDASASPASPQRELRPVAARAARRFAGGAAGSGRSRTTSYSATGSTGFPRRDELGVDDELVAGAQHSKTQRALGSMRMRPVPVDPHRLRRPRAHVSGRPPAAALRASRLALPPCGPRNHAGDHLARAPVRVRQDA